MNAVAAVARAAAWLLDWLAPLPAACLLCGRPWPDRAAGGAEWGAGLCRACRHALSPAWIRCASCGRLVAAAGEGGLSPVCGRCRLGPPSYRAVAQLGPYAGLLRWAVRRFKNGGETHLAQPLGTLLASVAVQRLPQADLLVPVPSTRAALARRGYSQCRLLAAVVAARLGLRVVPALERREGVPPQTGLSRSARAANAARAYAAGDTRSVRGRRVWLLDDVLTTGATLEACSRLLLACGAREIWCLVVAETVRPKRGRTLAR